MIKIIFVISKSFIICLIQEDIEMVVKDGKHKLVGFVDLGEMHDAFEKFSGTVIIEINVESFKRQQRACVYETAMFNSSPLFL